MQRGILFAFFVYSLILFAAFLIKFIKNWVDKEAKVSDEDDGAKYVDKTDGKKAEESNNELDASKKATT